MYKQVHQINEMRQKIIRNGYQTDYKTHDLGTVDLFFIRGLNNLKLWYK